MSGTQAAREEIHVIDSDFIIQAGSRDVRSVIDQNLLNAMLGEELLPISKLLPAGLCEAVAEVRSMVLRTYEEAGDFGAPFVEVFNRDMPDVDTWLNRIATISNEGLVVVRTDGEVVGTVRANFTDIVETLPVILPAVRSVFPQTPDEVAYIGGAFVLKPHRRNGLFGRMFASAEEWIARKAREFGSEHMLEVANTHPATPHSETMQAFLRENGFQPLPGYLTEGVKAQRPELGALSYFGKMVTVSSEL